MKILIINPDYGMTQEEMALRCRILEEYTAPDTQLAMVCPQSSGVELNSALDVVLAAPEIVQLAADGQNAGFDAVVLYCFSDPVIDACREALRIPVIGGAQASCLAALNVCRSFGVILADEATGNLDTRPSFEILVLFQKLHAEGRTIIFVTHNPEIAQYSSRNIVLRDGQVKDDKVNPDILNAAETLAALPKQEDD